MGSPFKERIDRAACELLARAYELDSDFVAAAAGPLPRMELKERVAHVADTLRARLDPHLPRALEQLVAGLPPGLTDTEKLDLGFAWWPAVTVVERFGVGHPEAALKALPELTRRFTAELAVRPILRHHPEPAWQAVRAWARSKNPHVRRLASEGTRPRLPWGGRLRHPPAWELLDSLVDDDELYVRRSVANHLGDLAKDHPRASVDHAAGWLRAPSSERAWVVRHGLRHLVKKGDRGALALQGFAEPVMNQVHFSVSPQRLRFPGHLTLDLTAQLPRAQDLVIDAVIHWVNARGGSAPKTMKWSTRSFPAGPLSISRRVPLKPVSTRTFRSGLHRVELQVNGRLLAEAAFDLEVPE